MLALLYVAQGLPFGVQATALPVLLRQHGASLADIGFAGALALPWTLKALWAPLVDGHGARHQWITATQWALAAVSLAAAAAIAYAGMDVRVLGLAILLLNFLAATQDIAVDGLAVAILGESGLGLGNAAQVVGYKFGMILGGGVLVWASGALGWPAVFCVMAAIYVCVWWATAAGVRDRERSQPRPQPESLASVVTMLRRAIFTAGTPAILLVIACYKIGETMITAMFKPFLVDAGFSAAQIGLWVGTWGMVASLAGSVAGGLAVQRFGPRRALVALAWLRCVAMVGEVLVARGHPTSGAVIAANCLEHGFGGALTTALFAWMMARVDLRIGASHYTLLASVEVLGKLLPGWGSGVFASSFGYFATFSLGLLLAVAYAICLPTLLRRCQQALPAPG